MEFGFISWWGFVFLVAIVCIYLCPPKKQKRYFVHLHLFSMKTKFFDKEKLLIALSLLFMVIAFAEPILYKQKPHFDQKGRDLVLVLDSSGSMDQSGFGIKGRSKFEIVKELFKDFITKRHDDNVAVVLFGTYAMAMSGLTYDMNALSYLLRFMQTGLVGENTAIGDGLYQALKLLKKGKAKEKVILLLTDGYQNSGSYSIKEMVQRAMQEGVKIYTIAIGESFDKGLLQRIAQNTNGKFFHAKMAKDLQAIYDKLDQLEPSKVRSSGYIYKKELFYLPLLGAIAILFYLLSIKREKVCSL